MSASFLSVVSCLAVVVVATLPSPHVVNANASIPHRDDGKASRGPPLPPVCNGAHALRHSSENNITMMATAWALLSLDHLAKMPVVACALPPRSPRAGASSALVALLGPNTDAERTPLVGLHASTSAFERAAQMAKAVITHCPSSRYAQYAEGAATSTLDNGHDALLRRHPANTHHDPGVDHEDHCTPSTRPQGGSGGSHWWEGVFGVWRFIVADDAAGGDNVDGGVANTGFWWITKAQDVLSCMTTSDMFRRLMGYPYHVSGGGLLRYFMDEVITIVATNISVPKTAFISGGARALMRSAHRALRVHAYPPLAPTNGSGSSKLVCDLQGLALLEDAYASLVSSSSHDGGYAAMFLHPRHAHVPPSAATSSSLMTQHCQFGLRGGDAAASVTPQWLRRALGFDRVVSQAHHSRPVMGSDGDYAVFSSECRITRRFADDSICLSVTATEVVGGAPPSSQPAGASEAPSIHVVVASELVLDTAWVLMWLALVGVTLLKPVVMARPMLQLLLCTLLGAVIVIAAILYYTLKDLQQTRIGKVGMFALLSAGGIFMVAEGLIGASIAVLVGQLQSSAMVQASVIGAGLVSAVFSHLMLRSLLPRIVSTAFTGAQVALVFLLWGKNSEASVCACFLVLLYLAQVPRLSVVLLWYVVVAVSRLLWTSTVAFARFATFRRSSTHADDGEPMDDVPTLADDHVAQYRRPTVSSAITGRTEEERLQAYEREGSMHTRRALEELAATVRAQPHKYAARVRDPNGLARFAGVGS